MRIPGNFDRWMFNYKEGNLSAEETAYFESFMLTNPDFIDDVNAWDSAFVRNNDIEYPHVNSLLKEKSGFANWKNWAAALLLLIGLGGSIGIGNHFLSDDKMKNTYSSNDTEASIISSIINYFINTTNLENSIDDNRENGEEDFEISSIITDFDNNLDQESENSIITSINNVKPSISLGKSIEENREEKGIYSKAFYLNKQKSSSTHKENRKLEISKIRGNNSFHSGKYSFNPNFDASLIDLSFKRQKVNALNFYLKRFFRKLDKITGYPIALINLRDPDLVIPNRNILNFNPGFTGSTHNFRIGADYRNQWTGELTNSQSGTFYFDSYIPSARGGIGASVTYSDYSGGVYRNMLASLFYSPKFVLGKHVVFEPAIKATMGRLASSGNKNLTEGIEFNRGNVIDQNPNFSKISNNFWFKDYGIGFVLNTDWFYVGGFIDNLAGHDQRIYSPSANNEIESSKLITGVVGFDYQSRNKRTTLSPFLTYYQYGIKKEAWAGATAQFNWLTIGASYSSNNEYAVSVGLKFKSFKLIYQTDMLESEFLQESFVSHNIGIRFNTKNKSTR